MDRDLTDQQVEQIVLGCVQTSPAVLDEVAAVISPRDLRNPAHQTIYLTVLDMADQGHPLEPTAVMAELTRRGELARVGGAPYLHTCLSAVPSVTHAAYYAGIVAKRAGFRRLAEVGTRLAQYGQDGTGDLAETQDRAWAELQQATEAETFLGGSDTDTLHDLWYETLDDIENPTQVDGEITVPHRDLSAYVPALQPGQLVTVAGRPGMGKSVFALDLARHASIRHGLPVLYVSLEMGRREVMRRIIAAETRVPMERLQTRALTESDWEAMARRQNDITAAPLHISTPEQCMLGVIRARLRMLARRAPVRLLIVDHIGLMTASERHENRQAEVAAHSRGLKQLALATGIPIVLVSQLNRATEGRGDTVPRLSDLRDSGSIEQDSDIVLMVHREDYYDRGSSRAGEVDIHVAKHRTGPTGSVTLANILHQQRFADMATPPADVDRRALATVRGGAV